MLTFIIVFALYLQVKEIFDESPFYVPQNSVTIMNGANEGKQNIQALECLKCLYTVKKIQLFLV